MKDLRKEMSRDCVKSSPFKGVRGGMLFIFLLASLYLLFAARKGTEGSVSDNRVAEQEITVPFTPDGLDNHVMDVDIHVINK